tara:strand:- start:182 stop:709 length:528 start_codon:yes stop_codon:yes gene_type:complete
MDRSTKRKSKTAIDKNISFFPHLKNVKESIEELKNYVEYLNVRIDTEPPEAFKTAYFLNERKILISETKIKISKANKTISERSEYFADYYKGLVEIYVEASTKFTELMLQANSLSLDKKFHANEKLNKELEEAAPYLEDMQKNWELKFRFYIEIKNIINSDPAAPDAVKKKLSKV